MPKIAIVGDRDTIMGFSALGLEMHAVSNPEGAAEALWRLCTPEYGVVFITENYAAQIQDVIRELAGFMPPTSSLVIIPGHEGSLGLGQAKIKGLMEKALGWDPFAARE